MTDDNHFLIGGVLLQIFLLAVLIAVVHPHVTMASVVCVLLLLVAEVAIYREVRGLKALSRPQIQPAPRKPRQTPSA